MSSLADWPGISSFRLLRGLEDTAFELSKQTVCCNLGPVSHYGLWPQKNKTMRVRVKGLPAAHLMQRFGILQVLHADFEAVGVGYAWSFNLRIIFLWHVQSSKLVLGGEEDSESMRGNI